VERLNQRRGKSETYLKQKKEFLKILKNRYRVAAVRLSLSNNVEETASGKKYTYITKPLLGSLTPDA
jgi:hypothetical protein